jgi:colanic acid biosynthesis glycosyl transferase WcaI
MRTRLLAHGIPTEKIFIAENWADRNEFASPNSRVSPAFEMEGLSILYSGNFGLAHDAQTISSAMLELEGRSTGVNPIRFIFAGGGSWHGWLQAFCRKHGLGNTMFLPYCERQELEARLASGHIGLVTQKPECLGSAVPSKTYGIMAAGRPILFIGPKESTPARIIARYGCGWQIDCGDVRGLVNLLEALSERPELIAEAGAQAHRAFVSHYQRSIGVARIVAILDSESKVATRAQAQTAVG